MLPLQSQPPHQDHEHDIQQLFPFITGPLRQEFEQHAECMTFDKGEKLYEDGFPCPFVPFIADGTVRVFKITEAGRELTLYRVHAGQVCVMSSTCSIANRQYTAIAEAEEPTSIYVVPGQSFRFMLRRYPELQDFIFDEMSQRMLELMGVVEEVAFWRVDYRLINRLLSETRPSTPPTPNWPLSWVRHGR